MPRAKRVRLVVPTPAGESGPEGSSGCATADGAGSSQTKQAPARRNIRGRRGGLKDMPNMPLDILVEIFGHMYPRDLLNLARTTKDFRAFLMSRNSAPFWKAAREQVEGLPDCPAHLSEPAYANLAFFSHCHECLKPNVKNVLWEFAARYCPACREIMITNDFFNLPFVSDVARVTSSYSGYLNEVRTPPTKGARYKDTHYLVSEVAEFQTKWASLSTDDEKKAFITERMTVVKERKEHAHEMYMWQRDQERNRSQELDVIKEARFEAIKKRLADEGWAQELDLMNNYELRSLSRHKAARKSQKLTDYGWQTIRRELHKYMEDVRVKRLDRERLNMLCARLSLLHHAVLEYNAARAPRTADIDWQPFFADYAMMPVFRELLDAPGDTEITKENLVEICESQLSTLDEKWREARREEFIALIKKAAESAELVLPEDAETVLSLAIATFDCHQCQHKGMRWPQVLAHRCARPPSLFDYIIGEDDKYRNAVTRTCIEHAVSQPWARQAIFKSNPVLAKMCVVIRACGKNPARVTFQEMETCGVRLLCGSCDSSTKVSLTHYTVFDWKNAARHGRDYWNVFAFDFYDYQHTPEWVRLDAEHTGKVLQLEGAQWEKKEAERLTSAGTTYGCARCRFRGALVKVREHYKRIHDNDDGENLELGADYYVHTDNPPSPLSPVQIYPEERRDEPNVAASVEAGRGFFTATRLVQPVAPSVSDDEL